MFMYTNYFGLKEAPFSIAPDPRYLFMSDQHREALAHLLYGVGNDGGFVLLTGEVGTGKTTVCRCLLEQLPENCDVAFIFNPKLTVKELLSTICDELRIKYPGGARSIKVFIDLINGYLLEAHAGGRKAVLIIDEAQRLSHEVLEQIRLLTNLETNERKLLQVILLGQPELQEMLSQPKLRQLSQRIIARYHLGPLTRKEVTDYVSHRLSIAGSSERLFPESTLREVFRLSGGIPRVINVLCDRALLGTYAQGRRSVNKNTVARAAREVFGERRREQRMTNTAYGLIFCGVVVIGAALFLAVGRHDRNSEQQPVVADTTASVERGAQALTESRKPIPDEAKGRAGERQIGETSDPDKIPWPLIEQASMIASLSTSTSGGLAVPREDSGNQDQENPPGEALEQAPPGLFQKFTGETRRRSAIMANHALLKLWGVSYQPDSAENACQQAAAKGLRCLDGRGDLNELRKLNLPAVLKLVDPQGQPFHVTLQTLRWETATVALDAETATVGIDELASLWKGEYTLLWRPPPQSEGNIREGDQGPAVKWLESRLHRVQGSAVPPRKDPVFDALLLERVKKYQLAKGLKPDGVVGPKTLIQLSIDASSNKMPLLMNKN
jgi:general secretion pathway protein A